MAQILLIGAGGFLGTILRYGFSLVFAGSSALIPLPVILVNLLGSFLLGLLLGIPDYKINSLMYQFLAVGLLGGFTTFSAFSGEAMGLLLKEQYVAAGVYLCVNVIGGLILCFLGLSLIKNLL